MKTSSISSSNNNTSFGAKTPNPDDLKIVKRFANCGINKFEEKLLESVRAKSPERIKSIDGVEYIADYSLSEKVINGVKSLFGMPLDFLDWVAGKIPNKALYNSNLLKRHRQAALLENEINAFQGFQEKGMKYVKEALPKGNYPTGNCNKHCQNACFQIRDKFNKKLNNQMKYNAADYDTKKERFLTRLISGFTSAVFLGNDFYNSAIEKGSTVEQAKKEQHQKQGQEIKENIMEAIAQFAILGCFAKAVNKNVWAPAIIGALIGLVARFTSRLIDGIPIRRIKAPPENNMMVKTPTIKEFTASFKAGDSNNKNNPNNKIEYVEQKIEEKAPLLSIKNISLFCLASVIGGYAFKYGANKTKFGGMISEFIKKRKDKFDKKTIENVVADRKTIDKLLKTLNNIDETEYVKSISNKLRDERGEEIILGTDFKKLKIFGAELNKREIIRARTALPRFIKELVTYPYKIVSKFINGFRKFMGKEVPKKKDILQDKYNIKNLYKRFVECDKKCGGDQDKLNQEFGNYMRKMRVLANNDVNSSSTDNSKIAVIAQTLGTLTGLWFNMNDEYNASIRNGATKQKAEKDARLRGINKFFRMTVQVIISGGLNAIFAKQYNNSIGKASLVVLGSTILTDMASRWLTEKPNYKMTKEELEQYHKKCKEGPLRHYYKMIDKLAS